MSDSCVDTLPTIKRGREVKRSTGGERGWGKDKKTKKKGGSQTGRGQRRGCEEGKGDEVESRGKNREEEEEEDVTGRQPAFLPGRKKEGLIESAISPCRKC